MHNHQQLNLKNKLSKQTEQNRMETTDMEFNWRFISWEGEEGEWGKRCRDYEVQIGRHRIDKGMLRTA